MSYHEIHFLHRTVKDFLRENHHNQLQKNAEDDFDAITSLYRIQVANLTYGHNPECLSLDFCGRSYVLRTQIRNQWQILRSCNQKVHMLHD